MRQNERAWLNHKEEQVLEGRPHLCGISGRRPHPGKVRQFTGQHADMLVSTLLGLPQPWSLPIPGLPDAVESSETQSQQGNQTEPQAM